MSSPQTTITGADPGGGGAPGARPPLKLEKIWFLGVKSWFFTRNTPQIFALPSAIGKNMIFCGKIVITELCNIHYQHLFTNLLYCDYKCICFINLLVGHYRIYGALIQGPLWKKSGPLWTKWGQILTRYLSLFLSFLT